MSESTKAQPQPTECAEPAGSEEQPPGKRSASEPPRQSTAPPSERSLLRQALEEHRGRWRQLTEEEARRVANVARGAGDVGYHLARRLLAPEVASRPGVALVDASVSKSAGRAYEWREADGNVWIRRRPSPPRGLFAMFRKLCG